MTRIPKILALIAFLTAAGCRDSYPSLQPPLDVFYYPVGLAVRQVQPAPGGPPKSQLVVVNSNFDLRYDFFTGGTVLVVDPDLSQDTADGGNLTVLGSTRMASFGGEVGLAGGACLPGWPDCPYACSTLDRDPAVAAGGTRLVFTSRSTPSIYSASMDAQGAIQCGDGCETVLPVARVDPYGVSIACSASAAVPVAYAFVTHLLSPNNVGWVSRVDLGAGSAIVPLLIGADGTYTTVFDGANDRLFVTSTATVNQQFRWFNPLTTPADVSGFLVPDFSSTGFSALLTGANARSMALSSDGLTLYVTVDLFDTTTAVQTGIVITQGGAVAYFDLTPSALGEPAMSIRGVTRTCLGAGQIRRLPGRPGKPDLFAITCDAEGALAILDGETRSVVRYVGRDTTTGLPVLGRLPFGLAVEPIDYARATKAVTNPTYEVTPCVEGGDCVRIYVGSFLDNWINVLEVDPDRPTDVSLVRRIGRGP